MCPIQISAVMRELQFFLLYITKYAKNTFLIRTNNVSQSTLNIYSLICSVQVLLQCLLAYYRRKMSVYICVRFMITRKKYHNLLKYFVMVLRSKGCGQ